MLQMYLPLQHIMDYMIQNIFCLFISMNLHNLEFILPLLIILLFLITLNLLKM